MTRVIYQQAENLRPDCELDERYPDIEQSNAVRRAQTIAGENSPYIPQPDTFRETPVK